MTAGASNDATGHNYEVWLLDSSGNRVTALEFSSLYYSQVLNSPGSLNLDLPDYKYWPMMRRDMRIAVYRDGKMAGDTVWLIRRAEQAIDANGTRTMRIGAHSALSILARRIVAYSAGTAYVNKTAAADNLMKAIVRENFNSLAVDTARSIASFMTVDADVSGGPSVSRSFSRRVVLEVLKDLANGAALAGTRVYFDVLAPTETSLRFATFATQRAADHRSGSTWPVVFSPDRGTLRDAVLSYDWNNEVSYIYAGGQGQGDNRVVVSVSDAALIGASPFGRIERWVDARQCNTVAEVTAEANSEIWKNRAQPRLSGKIVDMPGAAFGVNWGFGDRVTGEFDGLFFDATISTVQVWVTGGAESIEARFISD